MACSEYNYCAVDVSPFYRRRLVTKSRKHALFYSFLNMLRVVERCKGDSMRARCGAGPIKKGWWTLVSLGAICGLIYNMHSITTNYLSFPVNINIKIEHRTELSFPSVTLCNMSPVKRSSWTNKFGSVSSPVVSRKRRKRAGKQHYLTLYDCLILNYTTVTLCHSYYQPTYPVL